MNEKEKFYRVLRFGLTGCLSFIFLVILAVISIAVLGGLGYLN